MPIITFCIVHYKRLPHLKKCIEAIEKYTSVDYEVKLLRQGYQGEKTESYLKSLEKKENIEVIRVKRNVGCTPGRSLIVPKATTPLIMTLDNDIYVTQDWFKPVLEIFENEKGVGIVGLPLYSLNGKLANIGGTYLKIENGIIKQVRIKMPIDPEKDFLKVDGVSSGAMVFREEVRNDFNFDPRYFIGFGDIDKDIQLLNSKWRKVVCMKSRVFHDYSPESFSEYYDFRYNWIEIRRSYTKFMKKWDLRLPFKEHINYLFLRIMRYPFERTYRNIVTRFPAILNSMKQRKNGELVS